MRLIGNKTRLLDRIEDLLNENGVTGGTFVDIFSGTSSVGTHFKQLGFQVIANDLLSMCHAQAVSKIEIASYPTFARFRETHARSLGSAAFRQCVDVACEAAASRMSLPLEALPLVEAITFLGSEVKPVEGMIFRSFCPGGSHERMYFRDENGRKIDGILEFLRSSRREKTLTRGEFYLLLCSLLDAADRVANISGTYGAFLKAWQTNSMRDLKLEPRAVLVSDLEHRAYRRDANDLVREIDADVLYIDPPYNRRQYAANYHLMQIIAEYHRIEDLDAYEESLYGKTGLRPYDDLKSAYCVPKNSRNSRGNALSAMADLVLSSRAKSIVISYNEEGILGREDLGSILAEFSGASEFDYDRGFRSILYKRFRSDSNRDGSKGRTRNYKVLEGKQRDEIAEWLFFARRKTVSRSAKKATVKMRSSSS